MALSCARGFKCGYIDTGNNTKKKHALLSISRKKQSRIQQRHPKVGHTNTT
jgi:hypothetical protein